MTKTLGLGEIDDGNEITPKENNTQQNLKPTMN
jgi:hypothetical protein